MYCRQLQVGTVQPELQLLLKAGEAADWRSRNWPSDAGNGMGWACVRTRDKHAEVKVAAPKYSPAPPAEGGSPAAERAPLVSRWTHVPGGRMHFRASMS